MTFQTRTRDFMARYSLDHTPQTHALDLVSEVGEVAKSLLQASDYGRSSPKASPALSEELGDAFYSLVALAESLDIDLDTALDGALEKYQARLGAQGHAGSTHSREP